MLSDVLRVEQEKPAKIPKVMPLHIISRYLSNQPVNCETLHRASIEESFCHIQAISFLLIAKLSLAGRQMHIVSCLRKKRVNYVN
jgi:hypothetical protein